MTVAEKWPERLAPYVPTPRDVVERMLSLAQVKADDNVYDLGCGDGRIVIAAAQKYEARGVGVDIQPDLMLMAELGMSAAGVGHLVEFRLQDALTLDLRPATMIMLYLMDWSTTRFQEIISRSCKPGTRRFTLEGQILPRGARTLGTSDCHADQAGSAGRKK